MDSRDAVLVAGAGGFIGGHRVNDLLRSGVRRVRAVDVKPLDQWHQRFAAAENRVLDPSRREACAEAVGGIDQVYHNVYGPHGTYRVGREKAPAAICRKVAQAVLTGRDEIEIRGAGSRGGASRTSPQGSGHGLS